MNHRIGINTVILNKNTKYIRIIVNDKLVNRFMDKVSFNNNCWEFNSAINWKGYGRFGISYKGKQSLFHAHRISYVIYNGNIPKGLTVHHKCHNKKCVNPNHLELKTNDENRLEGNCWSAINARKTHCKHGHEFSKDNTRIWIRKNKKEMRVCKLCSYLNNKKWRNNIISARGVVA